MTLKNLLFVMNYKIISNKFNSVQVPLRSSSICLYVVSRYEFHFAVSRKEKTIDEDLLCTKDKSETIQ